MKVYIVTSGEYSDYRIDRVFTNEKLANEFCKMLKKYNPFDCANAQVEVYSTFPNDAGVYNFDTDNKRGRFFGYAIEKGGDFKVLYFENMPYSWYGDEELAIDEIKYRVEHDGNDNPLTDVPPYTIVFLKCFDPEKARKVAMDRVAKEKWEKVERGEDV